MKFKNKVDEMQFNLLRLDEVEVRKRLKLASKAKDHKKARTAKNQWRRGKLSLKKGLNKWHNSTGGKRFHRALGRFNSLRETVGHSWYYNSDDLIIPNREMKTITMTQVNDALLSLSSIETHLNIELGFYEPDPEALAQFIEIVEMFHNDASKLRNELMLAYSSGEIKVTCYMLLNDIIQFFQDPKMYVYSKRELEGYSNDTNSIDFVEQVSMAEATNHCNPGNEIYDAIDKLFIK